jgi:hypothetical protein
MWKGIAIGVGLVVESALCASAQTQSEETKRTLTQRSRSAGSRPMLRPCPKPAVRTNWCPTFALAWRLPELRQVLRRCLNRGRQCKSSQFLARRFRGSRGRGRSKSRSGCPHLSWSGCWNPRLSGRVLAKAFAQRPILKQNLMVAADCEPTSAFTRITQF